MLRQTADNRGGRLALALLGLGALSAAALAGDLAPTQGGKGARTETKVTARAEKPGADGKQKVVVVLEINAGWHAYANPVGNEGIAQAKTVVTVTAGAKPQSVKVEYPVGKLKKDKLVGDYRYYDGKVEIPVTVQRAKGDTSPLEVSVKYSTCNFKTEQCLPVEQVKGQCPPAETVLLKPSKS